MRRVMLTLCVSLLVVSSAGAAPKPRPFLDLGFEAQECTSSWVSLTNGRFETLVDRSDAASGGQSARIRFAGSGNWSQSQGYAIQLQTLPAAEVAGKQVRLSGLIRTEDVNPGNAGLWWSIEDRQGNFHGADSGDAASRTTPWREYETVIDVPSNAARVMFGIELAGGGTAWFDSLSIEVNGKPFVQGKQAVPPKPAPSAVSWLRKSAIPFATPEAGNGFDDLQPLRKLVGNARIVSLGEATHGTREFFQMKHRILELLVEEMGFTHFSIEASMPEAYRLNQYVLGGEGDPYQLIRGMQFWTWTTQEVVDMVRWMREYNASGKGTVQFTGFDMQFTELAALNVRSFLRVADAQYALEAEALITQADRAGGTRRVSPEDLAAARGVYEHMKEKRGDYLDRFPAEQVDWAIQNARVVVQCLEDIAGIRGRDVSMADNVDWILETAPPGSKIVLWAHNLHVNDRAGWMGRFLRQRHGKDMVIMGFAHGTGRYNSRAAIDGRLGSFDMAPPVPGSLEVYLGSAGMPRYILDLRRVPGGAPAQWLDAPRGFRNIGAREVRCGFLPATVADEYDAMIWFDRTNPSVLLPFE